MREFGSLGRLVAWVFLLGPVWAQLPSTLSLATVVMVLAKCASLFVKLKHQFYIDTCPPALLFSCCCLGGRHFDLSTVGQQRLSCYLLQCEGTWDGLCNSPVREGRGKRNPGLISQLVSHCCITLPDTTTTQDTEGWEMPSMKSWKLTQSPSKWEVTASSKQLQELMDLHVPTA